LGGRGGKHLVIQSETSLDGRMQAVYSYLCGREGGPERILNWDARVWRGQLPKWKKLESLPACRATPHMI
jgi:hypothetical protein